MEGYCPEGQDSVTVVAPWKKKKKKKNMNAAEIHSQPQGPALTHMKTSKHWSKRRTTSPQTHSSSQKKLDNSTDPSSNPTLNRTRQTTVSVLQSPVYSFYLSLVSAPFRMYLQIF